MSNYDVNIAIKTLLESNGIDKLNQEIGEVTKSASDLGKVWEENKGKIGIAAGAAFAGISYYIKGGIDEINEYNYSIQRLESIMSNATGATKEDTDALVAHAEALEKVGVASKDNIVTGMSQFATFEMSTEAIDALTDAYVDYVVAEKGATASSEDYKSMANGLAQALNGNYASLQRAGFILDDNTKSIIENGSEMEKVEAIVSVLNSTYKDFNKTAAETAEGKLIMLQRNIGNIRETIAGQFLPIVEKATEVIEKVVDKVAKWVEENPKLTSNIIKITLAVAGFVTIVASLGVIVPVLVTGLNTLAVVIGLVLRSVKLLTTGVTLLTKGLVFLATNPLGLVITAIAAVIAIGVLIYKNWDTIREKAVELGNKISEIWEGIKNFMGETWETIKTWASEKWEAIKEVFSEKLESIKTAISEKWEAIKEGVTGFLTGVGDKIAEGVENFKNNWIAGLNILKDKGIEIFNALPGPVQEVLTRIGDLITGIFDFIKKVFTTFIEFFKGIWEGFKAFFSGDLEGAGKIWSDTWSKLWNNIKDILSGIWETIKTTISNAWDNILTGISTAWDNIIAFFDNAKDAMINAITYPFEVAKEKVMAIWNWIKSKLEWINGSSDDAASSSGYSNRLYGGIVNAGTPYMVGEQGRELFIPSTSGRIVPNNQIGGGQSISINISGNQIRSEADAEILANKVINKLNFQMKMNGFGI